MKISKLANVVEPRSFGFIDDFNSVYGFVTNLGDLFGKIGGVFSPGNSISDSQRLEDIQNILNSMGKDISQLLELGNLTQDQINTILSMQKNQNNALGQIQNSLNTIQNYLNTYLPAILSGIRNLEVKSVIIINKLDAIMDYLKRLDEISDNVVLNSTLIDITSSYQALQYISNRYSILSSNFEKSASNRDNSASVINSTEYLELYDFADRLTNYALDNVIFHLEIINNSILGRNLTLRSSLALLIKSYISTSFPNESNASKAIRLISMLQLLQGRALGAFIACRAIKGLPYYDYADILAKNLTEQKETFLNILKMYSKMYNLNLLFSIQGGEYYDTVRTSKSEQYEVKAKKGNVITGLYFENLGEGKLKVVVREAPIRQNFQIDSGKIVDTELIFKTFDMWIESNFSVESKYYEDESGGEVDVITGVIIDSFEIKGAYSSKYNYLSGGGGK